MEPSIALPLGWETEPLAEELKTFMAHQAELLQTAKGQYALIKGNDVIGLFERKDDAFNEGYRRFRLKGFMVHRVQKDLDNYYIGGSALGVEE